MSVDGRSVDIRAESAGNGRVYTIHYTGSAA